MQLLKLFFSTSFLLLAFTLSGCQGNNSDVTENGGNNTKETGGLPTIDPNPNPNTELITTLLPVSNATLTTNEQSFSIVVKAIDSKNRPSSKGNIEIVFPNDVRTGRDIGSFDKFISPLNAQGEATFVYKGPANLDENTSNIVFGFFHDASPENVSSYTMRIVPDVNQTVNTTYKITTGITNNVTMLPEDTKSVNYSIVNANGVAVADASVKSITVSTLNPRIGRLREGQTTANTIKFTNNHISLSVISNTLSGIVPLSVNAIFNDANNVEQNLTKQFNIVVLSGPPSALSLNYSSTQANDGSTASFTENWILKVTDKYNNVVNTNPSVSMGMIAGYAVASPGVGATANHYLYFENGGTLSSTNNNFTAANVFANVNQATDTLVTFGDGYRYPASGKWDFNTNANTAVLDLVDRYEGNNTSGLGYAVGHNYRQDPAGGEAIATIRPKDNNFVLDSSGIMTLEVTYDYYLTGKDVVIWINMIGEDLKNRRTSKIGEAKKITLRANGLEDKVINTPPKIDGTTGRVYMKIKNTKEWYKDANFGCDIKFSDKLQLHGYTTSNGTLNGTAYIDFNVTDLSADGTAGTITLTGCAVSQEF